MKFLRALALLLCISPFTGPHAQDYGDKDAPECRHVECVVVESRGRGILIPSDDRLRREFEARLEAERRNPYRPRPAPPSANYYGTAPPPDPYAQPYSPPTRPVYGPPNPRSQPVHPKATSASEAITQYGHDALGRNTLIDDSEYGATVIDYWPDGRIRSIERSGGVVSEYTYDLAGRTETITHTRGAEVIARVAYDYDANGNRIEERLSQGGAERITTYEYDRDDRLIAVNTPDGRDEYTLDPVGNRIGEKSWAGDELINDITQDFDARDRIQSRSDAISGLTTSYQHDANGNLTAETVSGPGMPETTTTYVYDPENRLLEVRKPSGNVQYTFDAEGKRIASSASGRARYDAGSLYAELNGANQVIRRHHTSAPNRAASRGWMQRAAATLTLFLGFSDPGGATTQHFHHLHDALNTPIATTSADGSIAQRNIYDAFGNLEAQTSPNPYLAERPSRIGFTGYQLDRETSSEPEADGGISQTSYHAKARQYHAGRGSFMQQDPWAGDHTNPASLHRYLYAYANPGMFVDPDGRHAEPGHYYTAYYVGLETGFSPQEAQTLAFYSQLPDEVDHLDAIGAQADAILPGIGSSIVNFGLALTPSAPRLQLPKASSVKNRDATQKYLHALTGGYGPDETRQTLAAIRESGADLATTGLLIHRLGDSFAHCPRREQCFDTGFGHLTWWTSPDVIQNDPDGYRQYVGELALILAEIRGTPRIQALWQAARIQVELDDVAALGRNRSRPDRSSDEQLWRDPASTDAFQFEFDNPLPSDSALQAMSVELLREKLKAKGADLRYQPELLPDGLSAAGAYTPNFYVGKELRHATADFWSRSSFAITAKDARRALERAYELMERHSTATNERNTVTVKED